MAVAVMPVATVFSVSVAITVLAVTVAGKPCLYAVQHAARNGHIAA